MYALLLIKQPLYTLRACADGFCDNEPKMLQVLSQSANDNMGRGLRPSAGIGILKEKHPTLWARS
jgi:hypothetical protein